MRGGSESAGMGVGKGGYVTKPAARLCQRLILDYGERRLSVWWAKLCK